MTRSIDFKINVENKEAVKALGTLEALEKELDALKKNSATLDAGTAEFKKAQKAIAEMTDELIDAGVAALQASKDVGELNEEIGETTKEAGNMGEAYGLAGDKIDEASGGAIGSLMEIFKATKTAVTGMNALKIAVAATGIGLLVIAVVALTQAFTRSSDGSDKLTKIMGQLSVITNVILDLFADLGEILISVFEDPQEAIKEVGEFLKQNLINRVEGLLELIPALGSALKKAFSGDFSGAAEEATNAIAKVAIGVEDVTGKVDKLNKETGAYFDEVAKKQERQAQADNKNIEAKELEIELLAKRAKAESEIEKLRNKVADELGISAEERIQALQDIADKQNELNDLEIKASGLRRDALLLQAEGTKLTDEERTAIAEAQAEYIAFQGERNRIETERLDGERGFRQEALAKNAEYNQARLDAARTTEDNILDATDTRIANEQLSLERELQNVIENEELKGKAKLDAVAAAAQAIVENEQEALENQLARNQANLDRQIADTLANTTLLEDEKQALIVSLREQNEQADIAAEAEYNNRLIDREKQALADRDAAIKELEATLAEGNVDAPEPDENDFEGRMAKILEEAKIEAEALREAEAIKRAALDEALEAGYISEEEYDTKSTELTENTANANAAIAEKKKDKIVEVNEQEAASDKALQDAKLAATQGALTGISDLVSAFAGKSEKAQKKAFKIQKAISIATTLIDTYKGATAAFTGMTTAVPGPVGIALGAVAAAGVVASGIANVKKIKDQKFEGGSGSGDASTPQAPDLNAAADSVPTTGEPATPNFSLYGTGGDTSVGGDSDSGTVAQQAPIRAYVSETDLESTNSRLATIRQQSEL